MSEVSIGEVLIREFEPEDAAAFRDLNCEWIERYFTLEASDREVLWHPQATIVDKGGRILMAVRDGVQVGCCALVAMGSGEYEFAKMAVMPAERRNGIGRKLIAAAIDLAEGIGAQRLYLETNHTLTGAIALYESMGFRHLPAAQSHYARADVFMERFVNDAVTERSGT
jgi:putative acetyltransferase